MATATGDRKQEKDLTKETDAVFEKVEGLLKSDQLQTAIDELLLVEKQTRNAADLASTKRIISRILTIFHERRDWTGLREHIQLLTKKHGQLKQAVQAMVDEAMAFVDEIETKEEKIKFIEVLREVTDGKIYVEVPRARLTRQLAAIREADNDLAEASELLQNLQVETFGSMELREKTDFILEQMRLLRLRGDWEMMGIVSKKINTSRLNAEGSEDLKLRFYRLVILLSLHRDDYLDTCKYYRAIYDTPSVQADQAQWEPALRNAFYFLILAPFDNEQNDLLHRLKKDEKLEKLEHCYSLATVFTTPELMLWSGIEQSYGPYLRQTSVFAPEAGPIGGSGPVEGDIEESANERKGEKRWKDLHQRVIEHNIRTISTYYTRITLSRLSQMLYLDPKETEKSLAKLVVGKVVYARIDRLTGTVVFGEPRGITEVMNEWSEKSESLMTLVEKTCHLINKEYAVAAALKGRAIKA